MWENFAHGFGGTRAGWDDVRSSVTSAAQIAVAAIVENAGFGASYAAPMVRRVMDYWLAGLVPTEDDIAKVIAGKGGAPVGSYPGSFMETGPTVGTEVAQLPFRP